MKICSFVLLSVLFFSGLPLAYAGTPAVVSTKEEGKLVRPLLYSFVDFQWTAFGDLVADDFVPNKIDLMRQISESFSKGKPLNLDMLSGEVKTADGKKIIIFKWQKSFIDGASRQIVNKEGSAEFVFVSRNNVWLLFQINGDNPFVF